MPRAFYLILAVQFLSTLADNAFLIVAIARIVELSGPAWLIPLLKISFTLFYVILAPFVGPLADALPKGRVMVVANFLKVCAMVLLLSGVSPIVAIGVAGLGAAIYAPAKYGLITELLPARDLVRANGFFESTTVCAVILGTVLGGVLVSPVMPQLGSTFALHMDAMASTTLVAGMLVLLTMNFIAMLLSLGVLDSGARYAPHSFHPAELVRGFVSGNSLLWRDPQGGMSMAVTTLLWGVGATLQLIVLRWANEVLGLPLAQAAYLQGVTALGVVVGAVCASRMVSLKNAERLLPMGILLGLLVLNLLWIESPVTAAIMLVVVGGIAGFFVVPMNALLQHRGCTLLTAGRSVAVQGFNENGGMLLMLAIYAGAIGLQLPLFSLIVGFAMFIALGMTVIWIFWRRAEQSSIKRRICNIH
jgi:MFS family permease